MTPNWVNMPEKRVAIQRDLHRLEDSANRSCVKSRHVRSIIKTSLPLSIFVCLDNCTGVLDWVRIPVTLKHVTWTKPRVRVDFICEDIVFNCEVPILIVSLEPSQQCKEAALGQTTGTSGCWKNMEAWESFYVWNKTCRISKRLWEDFRKGYTDHRRCEMVSRWGVAVQATILQPAKEAIEMGMRKDVIQHRQGKQRSVVYSFLKELGGT